MQVPTFATAGDQGTKTVYFDIAPFDDERVFLEGGRETVRYTVHIDDSEAGSQQVEADTTVDETPPQLQSATVDGSSLTLAYDEEPRQRNRADQRLHRERQRVSPPGPGRGRGRIQRSSVPIRAGGGGGRGYRGLHHSHGGIG